MFTTLAGQTKPTSWSSQNLYSFLVRIDEVIDPLDTSLDLDLKGAS